MFLNVKSAVQQFYVSVYLPVVEKLACGSGEGLRVERAWIAQKVLSVEQIRLSHAGKPQCVWVSQCTFRQFAYLADCSVCIALSALNAVARGGASSGCVGID